MNARKLINTILIICGIFLNKHIFCCNNSCKKPQNTTSSSKCKMNNDPNITKSKIHKNNLINNNIDVNNLNKNVENITPQNDKTKTKTKTKNIENTKQPYEEMYTQMSQYFKDDFINNLINERKKLKEIGICNALDNIITNSLIFIPYFKKSKKNLNTLTQLDIPKHVNLAKKKKDKSNGIKSTNMYGDLATIKNEKAFKDLKDEFTFPSGAIFIDNEYFKCLRCEGGCHNNNCVSCKLYDYLNEKGLVNLFVSIYLNQGNSSGSDYSRLIKKIINEGLKEEIKSSINYYEPSEWNKEITIDDKVEAIKKCFFIEWALTIEFLTRFSKILSADGNLTLYRVVKIDEEKIKKISPYESTSIFGQPFIPQYSPNEGKCFKVEKADIWRCIFSYVISPDGSSMFYSNITDPKERKYLDSLDYELEIGYIPIGKEKDYKYNSNIEDAHSELEKKCKEFYKQNINKIYDKNGKLLLRFQNDIKTLIEGNYEDYKPEDDDE